MTSARKRFASGVLLASFFLLTVVSDANALPAFARKYGLRCSACHEAWPMLNYFGQKFKDNGSTSTDSADKVAVQVTTSPKGATIYVDGTQVSKKTPNKLSLAPGDYEIQLKLEGYNPLTRKITVEKDTPLAVNETLQK